MVQAYQTPTREFTAPTTLVIVEVPWYRGDVPVKHVPLERRTGVVRVVYSSALSIRGPEQDDLYPHGAFFRYDPGCEVALEVLQRGLSQAELKRRGERGIGSLPRSRLLKNTQTPIVACRECYVGSMGTSTSHRMRVVLPRNLNRYLTGVLPLIGVAPGDVARAVQYLEGKLEQGRRELVRL